LIFVAGGWRNRTAHPSGFLQQREKVARHPVHFGSFLCRSANWKLSLAGNSKFGVTVVAFGGTVIY
jgi:hypothetical protein